MTMNHPHHRTGAATAGEDTSALLYLNCSPQLSLMNRSAWKSALRKDYLGSNNVSACGININQKSRRVKTRKDEREITQVG
jgi:hypothetical protein